MRRKITCRVTPNARNSEVGEFEQDPELGEVLRVRVQAPPADGKANKEVILTLAKHFGVKKRNIRLLRGEKSRVKFIEICAD